MYGAPNLEPSTNESEKEMRLVIRRRAPTYGITRMRERETEKVDRLNSVGSLLFNNKEEDEDEEEKQNITRVGT